MILISVSIELRAIIESYITDYQSCFIEKEAKFMDQSQESNPPENVQEQM